MRRPRCSACLVVLFGLAAGLATAVAPTVEAATAARVGTGCPTAGARTGTGTKALRCVKTSKGLRWASVGAASTVPPSTASDTGASASSTSVSSSSEPTRRAAAETTVAGRSGATRGGTLQGAPPYRAAGRVELTEAARTVLRFRAADIQSGPALVVYLTQSPGATTTNGALRIGPLAATKGDHDYDVPGGADPAAYSGVLIWCERFGVPFGTAELR